MSSLCNSLFAMCGTPTLSIKYVNDIPKLTRSKAIVYADETPAPNTGVYIQRKCKNIY
jgi:hypothetical protein